MKQKTPSKGSTKISRQTGLSSIKFSKIIAHGDLRANFLKFGGFSFLGESG